jgi:dTDP-4-dehydrorhamnose reductase
MKILVTGAKGMLGKDLIPVLKESSHEVVETDIEELDITKAGSLREEAKRIAPEVIINCAAYTQVDKAEEEPDKAFLINGIGVRNLALLSKDWDIPLCHISTDYVFNGEKTGPYLPNDPTDPVNMYGYTKLAGEKYLQWIGNKFYILRTSWLYGQFGKNFVYTILRLAKDQKELKVVDDQIGSPTWTVTLSQIISKIIQTPKYGIYHVTDKTEKGISWFQFAQEIVGLSGLESQIFPVMTEAFPRPAKRPRNSVLDLEAIQTALHQDLPSWEESLNGFLARLS